MREGLAELARRGVEAIVRYAGGGSAVQDVGGPGHQNPCLPVCALDPACSRTSRRLAAARPARRSLTTPGPERNAPPWGLGAGWPGGGGMRGGARVVWARAEGRELGAPGVVGRGLVPKGGVGQALGPEAPLLDERNQEMPAARKRILLQPNAPSCPAAEDCGVGGIRHRRSGFVEGPTEQITPQECSAAPDSGSPLSLASSESRRAG